MMKRSFVLKLNRTCFLVNATFFHTFLFPSTFLYNNQYISSFKHVSTLYGKTVDQAYYFLLCPNHSGLVKSSRSPLWRSVFSRFLKKFGRRFSKLSAKLARNVSWWHQLCLATLSDIVAMVVYSMYLRPNIQNANIVYSSSFGRKLDSWESFAGPFFSSHGHVGCSLSEEGAPALALQSYRYVLELQRQKKQRVIRPHLLAALKARDNGREPFSSGRTQCGLACLSNSFPRNFWDWPSVFFLEVLVQNKYSAICMWFSPQNAYVSIRIDKTTNAFGTNRAASLQRCLPLMMCVFFGGSANICGFHRFCSGSHRSCLVFF